MSILKKIIPIALSLSMIACGGGGTSKSPSSNNSDEGNSTTPSTPDLTFQLDTALIELEENSNAVFQLNQVEPNEAIEYTISFSIEINEASLSIENNELLIDVNELENDKSTKVTITASLPDKSITFEQSVELTLFNSSFEQFKAWSDVDAIFEFNDFSLLPAFYAKAAYLHRAISYSEHKTYIDEYNTLLTSVKNQKVDFSSHSFIDAIASYEQNTMTESEVEDAFNIFKTQLLAQYDPLIEQLNAVASQLEGKVPLLSVGKLKYIPEYEAFSGIVGDTSLGGFSESTWAFTPENSVLESLIPMLGASDCKASSTGE